MPLGTWTLFSMNTRFKGNTCKIFKTWSWDISALDYGKTPYETEHQVRRGDTEDIVKKTKQAEAALTLVQKVRSSTGYDRSETLRHWFFFFFASFFHIDFFFLSVQSVRNVRVKHHTSCTSVKPGVVHTAAKMCVCVQILDSLMNQIRKGAQLNDEVDVLCVCKCNCWCQIWGNQRDKSLKHQHINSVFSEQNMNPKVTTMSLSYNMIIEIW